MFEIMILSICRADYSYRLVIGPITCMAVISVQLSSGLHFVML